MDERPHLVIAGGSGFLGLNWAARMATGYRVTLLQHVRRIPLAGAAVIQADLGNAASVQALIDQLRPDVLVNCSGMTDVEACEADPAGARRANVDLPRSLALAARSVGAAFLHVSTDHLFDGTRANLDETEPTQALNAYARSKAEGEAAVLAAHPEALVLRTNFYGWGPMHRASFSDRILAGLRAGQDLHLFEDTWFSPIFVDDLVVMAHEICAAGARGIVNLVGPERLTKLEFGLRLARVFGEDERLIHPSRLSMRDDLTPRPLDMSLDDSLMVSILGRQARPVAEAFATMRAQEKSHAIRNIGRSMIPYGRHHIDEEDIDAVTNFLRERGWLTQGPTVQAFEDKIASLCGAKYAVAVSSATAGLHLACLAAGLEPGKKMITSPVTFVASANAATYCGAGVVFCDIDPETANLCPDQVEAALKADPSIRVIMPVHFAGLPCDMVRLRALADAYDCTLIEDAAHALGSQYPDGSPVGSGKFADMAVFSFHPVKAIALGEGGLVATNDEGLYRALLRLRSHGINKLDDDFEHPEEAGPWYYEMQELGFNYRITDLQCALGLSQAKKLGAFVTRRRLLADRYGNALAGWSHVTRAQSVDTSLSAHHVYVLQIDFAGLGTTRADFMNDMRAMGIGSQVHYVPVPMHPYYRHMGHSMDALPNALAYYDKALTIPLYFGLGLDVQDQVIDVLAQLTGNACSAVAVTA